MLDLRKHRIKQTQFPLIGKLGFAGYRITASCNHTDYTGETLEDHYHTLADYFNDFCWQTDVFTPRELYWYWQHAISTKDVVVYNNEGFVLWDDNMEASYD